MAHVARPTYTRTIPANAERCVVKDKPGVRWKGRGGKWVYGIISSNPLRCLVESSKHRVYYRDHQGQRASARAFRDRSASEHLMQTLVTQSARIEAGQLSPAAIRPRLSLTELLDKWERYMLGNGATSKGSNRQRVRAQSVTDGIGAERVSDLSPPDVIEWIDARLRANRVNNRAFGRSTAKNYIGAVKSFTRWCLVVEQAEPVDHLSALKWQRPNNETRIVRRALSEKELADFLSATRASERTLYGLNGRERYALYLFACSTGFRAEECAGMTPASFDRSRNEVTIEGKRAKNRKTATIPIDAAILHEVKRLFSHGDPVWPNRVKPSQAWWANGARMVRADLADAGIPFEVEGRRFDFHSLRGQFATDLDRAGVSLARTQKLMRHSDPRLTARHYSKPELIELAKEVGKLKRPRSRS